MITEIEENEYDFTREYRDKYNIFSFLSVSIKQYKESNVLVLTQNILINNILETVVISDCNTRGSPTNFTPLGTDSNVPNFKEQWNYASVIGMLMYLSSNSHPGIQFSVPQCAQFSHVHRSSHEESINHICQ